MILNIQTTEPATPIYFATLSQHHEQESLNRPVGLTSLYQILQVTSGRGKLRCQDKEYELSPGCAFYLAPGVAHSYTNEGDLITAWITFSGEVCNSISRLTGGGFAFFEDTDISAFSEALTAISNEYSESRREWVISALVYSLVVSFFEPRRPAKTSAMDTAIRYMEENYSRKITLGELCRVCHMSKSGFSKHFKDKFGCSAFEKLIEIRLLRAECLLKMNPDDKVSSIAAATGFEDVSYFHKMYRRYFGTSPRGNS